MLIECLSIRIFLLKLWVFIPAFVVDSAFHEGDSPNVKSLMTDGVLQIKVL